MMKLKNREQIDRIRESCQLLSRMFKEIAPLVQEGAVTKDLDAWAFDFIKKNGGKPAFKGYMNFPATLCISINEEVIHGIPSSRKIQDGDLVSIDCGIDLKGYFSDMAYTFPVGKVSEQDKKLLKITEESLYRGIDQAIYGNRIKDIGRAVSSHVTPHGYGIVKDYCGHGVGFSQHEEPQVPNYVGTGPNPRLAAGMILAIEPMINLGTGDVRVLGDDWTVVTTDGKRSAHFEHTVAIFHDRTEILTLGE